MEAIIAGMEQRKLLGKLRFLVDLRANMGTEHLVKLLKKMGVAKVTLGMESGSNKILQYLKGKNVTVDDNRNKIKILNKHSIGAYCCFMIGAPPEMIEDIQLTRDLIQEILDRDIKNYCQLTVATSLLGTKLWNYAIEKGHINNNIEWRQFGLSSQNST